MMLIKSNDIQVNLKDVDDNGDGLIFIHRYNSKEKIFKFNLTLKCNRTNLIIILNIYKIYL